MPLDRLLVGSILFDAVAVCEEIHPIFALGVLLCYVIGELFLSFLCPNALDDLPHNHKGLFVGGEVEVLHVLTSGLVQPASVALVLNQQIFVVGDKLAIGVVGPKLPEK